MKYIDAVQKRIALCNELLTKELPPAIRGKIVHELKIYEAKEFFLRNNYEKEGALSREYETCRQQLKTELNQNEPIPNPSSENPVIVEEQPQQERLMPRSEIQEVPVEVDKQMILTNYADQIKARDAGVKEMWDSNAPFRHPESDPAPDGNVQDEVASAKQKEALFKTVPHMRPVTVEQELNALSSAQQVLEKTQEKIKQTQTYTAKSCLEETHKKVKIIKDIVIGDFEDKPKDNTGANSLIAPGNYTLNHKFENETAQQAYIGLPTKDIWWDDFWQTYVYTTRGKGTFHYEGSLKIEPESKPQVTSTQEPEQKPQVITKEQLVKGKRALKHLVTGYADKEGGSDTYTNVLKNPGDAEINAAEAAARKQANHIGRLERLLDILGCPAYIVSWIKSKMTYTNLALAGISVATLGFTIYKTGFKGAFSGVLEIAMTYKDKGLFPAIGSAVSFLFSTKPSIATGANSTKNEIEKQPATKNTVKIKLSDIPTASNASNVAPVDLLEQINTKIRENPLETAGVGIVVGLMAAKRKNPTILFSGIRGTPYGFPKSTFKNHYYK